MGLQDNSSVSRANRKPNDSRKKSECLALVSMNRGFWHDYLIDLGREDSSADKICLCKKEEERHDRERRSSPYE